MTKTTDFIGKEVRLFPGDTHYKFAILINIDEYGYTFKITECHINGDYTVGQIVFFNHSCKVNFIPRKETI